MTKSIHKSGQQREWELKLFPDSVVVPSLIWRNPLNPNSLRLTQTGHKLVSTNHVFYQFKIQKLSNLQLLQLDHLLQSPYFVRYRCMIDLLGEQDSIMLSLHGNNLAQYLDDLDRG